MTQADYDAIVESISAARKASGMFLTGGIPMGDVQATANAAWCELGQRMGFYGVSVRPGATQLHFTAIPTGEKS